MIATKLSARFLRRTCFLSAYSMSEQCPSVTISLQAKPPATVLPLSDIAFISSAPTQPTAPIPSQSHPWVFRPVSPSALEPTILCAAPSASPAFCSHRHAGRQQQHCSARFHRLMRCNSEVRTRMDELFRIQHEDGASIPTFSVGCLCLLMPFYALFLCMLTPSVQLPHATRSPLQPYHIHVKFSNVSC